MLPAMSGAEPGQSPPARRWTGEPAGVQTRPCASSRKSDNRRREVRSGFAVGPASWICPPPTRPTSGPADRARGHGQTTERAEARGQRARAPLFLFVSTATDVSACFRRHPSLVSQPRAKGPASARRTGIAGYSQEYRRQVKHIGPWRRSSSGNHAIKATLSTNILLTELAAAPRR
jgi:hypothetical protein